MKSLKKINFIEKSVQKSSNTSFVPDYLISSVDLNSIRGGFGGANVDGSPYGQCAYNSCIYNTPCGDTNQPSCDCNGSNMPCPSDEAPCSFNSPG